MRRENLETVKMVMKMNVEGRRGRRKTEEVVGCDWGVCIDNVGVRVKWRFRTRVADPQITGIKAREKKKNKI